ncbi:hypothetical protein [Candidatus Nitrospira bockiana]
MTETQHVVMTIHRVVGYPVAFLLVPIALATFGGTRGHRFTGRAYLAGMVFLYVTGSYLTLTRHAWWSWDFARNLTFNFFGFSMLFYGWRAIFLYRKAGEPEPGPWDYGLATLLTATVVALASVAIWKDTPMRVFTLLGLLLVALEWRDLRRRFHPKHVLFQRHVRFILASYFYVLTVVSIVHLSEELPGKVKWLWPSVLGAVVIYLATGESNRAPAPYRRPALRWSILATLLVSIALGSYSVYKATTGQLAIDRLPRVAAESHQTR